MAQNLQLLKRRIKTSKNIAQIAKAMEMISASKIKRAQKTVENNKPYYEKITNLTKSILANADLSKFTHPYIEERKVDKTLLVVVSPDKGLCGSLNTNLFKKLLMEDNKSLEIVTMGKKAGQFSRRLEGELLDEFTIGTTMPDYSVVFNLLEIINNEYISGKVSSVNVLYTQFNSIFSQEPVIKNLLPIAPAGEKVELPYIFEPRPEEILVDLLPYFIEVSIYSMIIEAFTSEQAARMVAMQNAKNNALDIADYLTLSYNKSRQERITNELLSLSNNI